jgi:hypothetical protein
VVTAVECNKERRRMMMSCSIGHRRGPMPKAKKEVVEVAETALV